MNGESELGSEQVLNLTLEEPPALGEQANLK